MTFFGPDLRNGLPIGLGSVAGFGIAPRFSPASLFAGTVQGAWYDPSDATTLFSDRAGTTPCGTPGGGSVVPVGLMLDKSQGLVLGSELVSGTWANGTAFPFDTFTASGTGFTGNKTAFGISQAVLPAGASITSGAFYRVEVRVTFADDEDITVSFQNASGGGGIASSSSFSFGNISAATTIVGYVRGTSTGTAYLQMSQQGTNRTLTVASVSVKLIAGNHAIAANDTTARPELRARVNLLLRSEEFNNAAWTSVDATITANAGVAPDGSTTADKFTPNNTIATAYLVQTGVPVSAGTYTVSVYAKAVELTAIRVGDFGNPTDGYGHAVFNLSAGTVTSQTNCTATITNADNGWYRCAITRTLTSGTSNQVQIARNTVTGNGTSGVLIWGAQLTATNEFPANTYQRIVDANTYDAVGFPRYLVANGTSTLMTHGFGINANVTLMAAARRTGGTGEQGLFGATPPSTRLVGLLTANAVNPNWGTYAGAAFQSSGQSILETSAVISNVAEPSLPSQKLYTNQSLSATITGALYGGDAQERRIIFADNTAPATRLFAGNLYGIIAVAKILTDGERTSAVTWLGNKMGQTI